MILNITQVFKPKIDNIINIDVEIKFIIIIVEKWDYKW